MSQITRPKQQSGKLPEEIILTASKSQTGEYYNVREKIHKCGIYVQMNFCLKDEDYTYSYTFVSPTYLRESLSTVQF